MNHVLKLSYPVAHSKVLPQIIKLKAKRSSFLEVIVMPKVKVNDIQIYYEVKGEGFPLVMINGLGGNLDSWGNYY